MEQAQQQDGDESLAAWIKRIIRKELQQRSIEPKGWHMTKEQKNSQPVEAESKAEPMQFPLESFLKKLKEDQRKKAKVDPEEWFMRDTERGKWRDAIAVVFLVATAYSTYWIVKARIWLTR